MSEYLYLIAKAERTAKKEREYRDARPRFLYGKDKHVEVRRGTTLKRTGRKMFAVDPSGVGTLNRSLERGDIRITHRKTGKRVSHYKPGMWTNEEVYAD